MSTLVDLMPQVSEEKAVNDATQAFRHSPSITSASWSPSAFAEAQIRGLVQQLFLNNSNKRLRQVLFSSVDADTDTASICRLLAECLSQMDCGTTCLVAADTRSQGFPGANDVGSPDSEKRLGCLRNASQQLSSRLWLVPRDLLWTAGNTVSAAFLSGRLADLVREFDYTILQAPPVGMYREAALLGSLCDGVVLVLQANLSRRIAAQQVKETLHAANARLLGTVLSERSFPIPEAIYKRL
jgi:hypothetical protein